MGQAPLPPHERTWRHPSELAAAEREAFRTAAVPASTRLVAMVTGTVGLLAIGVLILSVTPGGSQSPIAISATTTPVAAGAGFGPGGIVGIGRLGDANAPTVPAKKQPALATPIGDGRSALMTRVSATGVAGDAFDVRLTSGPVVTAAVVETTEDGVVVVTISRADPDGHAVAGALPDDDEIVTILADPPVTVPFGDVHTVGADEGTPVLDADGDLIGLCTKSSDGAMTVVDVTGEGGDGTDDSVPPSSTATTDPPPVSDAGGVATTVAP